MIELTEYLDSHDVSPFGDWLDGLDAQAAAKITKALIQMENGNFSNAKGVGEGVQEYRINFGPGYRIYFGKDGEQIVILLGGGTKKRQQNDIDSARLRWADYKKRKGE